MASWAVAAASVSAEGLSLAFGDTVHMTSNITGLTQNIAKPQKRVRLLD